MKLTTSVASLLLVFILSTLLASSSTFAANTFTISLPLSANIRGRLGNVPSATKLQTGQCGNCGSGDLCNAWGEISQSVSPRGIRARVNVPNPTPPIRDGKWSFMRVGTAGVPVGNPAGWHVIESGWMKDPCFVTPGCWRYGSWKREVRHFIVVLNYNGYQSWDVANTSPGWTHEYRVEKDANGPGWLAYIDSYLAANVWLDYLDPTLTIGGGEVPNPPNNGMGPSTFSNVKYKDPAHVWHDVNNNYQTVVTTPNTSYHADRINATSWRVYGCN